MNRFILRTARRWWRTAALLVVFLGVAAATAPFINAGAYAGSIQRGLEASLGRKVSFREARFTLLFGPGFSLSDVTIEEDPKFGLEPFAYVPTLRARLRLDRLLLGQVVFSSVRLVEPSINIVRRDDGAWNMMELADRLSSKGGTSVHLFPAVQVSDGRLDFKLGVRKTTIYLTETSLSVYGEDGGKLYIQFAGSPARTDRAGNGFGSISGHVNWYPHPATAQANQLEGNIKLDRSNLSELSTFFRGEDAGVHGIVSGQARVAGPASALHVIGSLRFEDLHRWDLLPSSGENWDVAYEGLIDVPARSLNLHTVHESGQGSSPVELAVNGVDFLAHPAWSMTATLNGAPARGLLPLARRMGLDLPEALHVDGSISGALSYEAAKGWTGGVGISNFTASVPNAPAFHAEVVQAKLEPERIHLDSGRITSNDAGWLDVSGDFDRHGKRFSVSLGMNGFPARNLRDLFANWVEWPAAIESLQAGDVTGTLNYDWMPDKTAVWSGKLAVEDGQIAIPQLPEQLADAKGQLTFDPGQIDLTQFTASYKKRIVHGSLHLDQLAMPHRFRLQLSGSDLSDWQTVLSPGKDANWLARLGVGRYHAPEWVHDVDLTGDVDLPQTTLNTIAVGEVRSHVRWIGLSIQLSALHVRLQPGQIDGAATISLGGDAPKYTLNASLSELPWRGGFLSAQGIAQSAGVGEDALRRLSAKGTFAGRDVALSSDDLLGSVSGKFQLSFADGWPDLHLSDVQATQGDELWTGAASSSSDGKLVLDLQQHDGRQRRIVSTLSAGADTATSALR